MSKIHKSKHREDRQFRSDPKIQTRPQTEQDVQQTSTPMKKRHRTHTTSQSGAKKHKAIEEGIAQTQYTVPLPPPPCSKPVSVPATAPHRVCGQDAVSDVGRHGVRIKVLEDRGRMLETGERGLQASLRRLEEENRLIKHKSDWLEMEAREHHGLKLSHQALQKQVMFISQQVSVTQAFVTQNKTEFNIFRAAAQTHAVLGSSLNPSLTMSSAQTLSGQLQGVQANAGYQRGSQGMALPRGGLETCKPQAATNASTITNASGRGSGSGNGRAAILPTLSPSKVAERTDALYDGL